MNVKKVTKDDFVDFFSKLSVTDIRLRFSSNSLNNDYAIKYACEKDINKGTTFGIYDDTRLVAVCELVPFSDNSCEIAIAVLDGYKHKGMGKFLFKTGIAWCATVGYNKLYSLCLVDNNWMVRIAKEEGMQIKSDYHQSEATKNVPSLIITKNEVFNKTLEMMHDYKIVDYTNFWKRNE